MNKLIGIGGISRSGKTTLANLLKSSFHDLLHLDLDEYVLSPQQLPRIEGIEDWEHPHSVDWKRVFQHIEDGLKMHKIVLVEGILAFAHPQLNRRYDAGIYLNLPKEIYLTRRRAEQRWGHEAEWYLHYVWDAHKVYGRPCYPLAGWLEMDFRKETLAFARAKALILGN